MHYYNKISQGYEELHKEEQLNKLRIIKENLNVGNSLLDVGCGTGFSLDLFDAEKKVGIDPSEELVKIGKRQERNLIVGSAESLPFKDDEFDSVICVTVAHHFSDLKKCFQEMKRVCRKEKSNFGFSVLKKSASFDKIRKTIKNNFIINKEIDEGNDIIFICSK
jgi:ubiquinone/menaquinone biosynthesis C-methylase UbiE